MARLKSNPSNFTLSDKGDKNMEKTIDSSRSIYAGAGLKLDAFDCFHNVLNECVSEYTFTIADAALILKQLTPDIIKKIIPILSKQHCLSPKKKKTLDITEHYEESVMDLEVSKITNEKKGTEENDIVKRKSALKRPDASRPTRMLSPGSNSCSPVSAAVQALISISVPVVGSTNTNTTTQAGGHKRTVQLQIYNNKSVSKEETVFIPVSKPETKSSDFESVVAPVPKSALLSSNKDLVQTTSYVPSQNEIEEVFVGSKIDGICEPQNFYKNIASSLLEPISTSTLPDMQGVNSNIGGAAMLPTSSNNVCANQLFASKPADFQSTMNKTFTTDAILPHFNLFTSSALSAEMSCSIPTFQNPGSLMTTQVGQETQPQIANILPKLKCIQSQSSQMAYLDQSVPNVSEESTTNYNRNQLPVLRPILPKPLSSESLSNNMNIISVISSTSVASTNTISQLSPVIKMEEKKVISVPPNQIFTKLNPVLNPNEFAAMSAASSLVQQRPILANASCFFPNQNDSIFYTQGKELRQLLPQFFNDNLLKAKLDASSFQRDTSVPSKAKKKNDNPGGNLEVASALLSMGTEPESESEKPVPADAASCLSNAVLVAIKEELKTDLVINDQGCFQLEDVEIDPRKHQIKLDNFQCGNCKRVFTSILYLARHIKRVCPDMSSRKWKCEQCSKAFRHPFGLQQHMFTHTGERPHKCGQCTKAFYSANDLRRHVRTHSGERPYQCSHCEKRFSTTISLRTHTYIHTGERPHKCPHCTKTFATSSKLSRHVVTHSDKRPFPCDQCSKTFNRSGDLRRHYSQNHGKKQDLLDCDQCNKTFASEKALVTHKTTHQRSVQDTLKGDCYFGN